jgi:acylphosphatase
MVRYEVIFKGRVQGVGFRYMTQDYAQELGLLGWVRNLGDGSVQMVVEGEEKVVLELIKRIEARFPIREKTVDRRVIAQFEFSDFDITY